MTSRYLSVTLIRYHFFFRPSLDWFLSECFWNLWANELYDILMTFKVFFFVFIVLEFRVSVLMLHFMFIFQLLSVLTKVVSLSEDFKTVFAMVCWILSHDVILNIADCILNLKEVFRKCSLKSCSLKRCSLKSCSLKRCSLKRCSLKSCSLKRYSLKRCSLKFRKI